MKNLVTTCALIFIILFSKVSIGEEITEQSVYSALAEIEDAATNLDAKRLLDTLNDDVDIIFHITKERNTVIKKHYTKKKYASMLMRQWKKIRNYTYKMSNISVSIINNKAIATFDVIESRMVKEQIRYTFSEESVTLNVKNGSLKTAKLFSKIHYRRIDIMNSSKTPFI